MNGDESFSVGGGVTGYLRDRKSRDGETVADAKRTTTEAQQVPVDGMEAEFTSAELQEFLEADGYDVPADPEFKERLRESLWQMVKRMRREDRGDA